LDKDPGRIIYLNSVLSQAYRLLGLADRNTLSDTYGCFDRQYWHYNTCDTPASRCQESCLTLLWLYLAKSESNPFKNNKSIFDASRGAVDFWKKIQNGNGSFNEWYPNESSFVASAFTLYAVSEHSLLLKKHLNIKEWPEKEILRTARFLMDKDEGRVLNQQSGAAIALYNVYLLSGNEIYKDASQEKIKFICARQKSEGWFDEYGGPDIGYLSLMIDYLCKYYQKNPSDELSATIEKAVGFISHFFFPDFSSGGVFASRNTEYIIPHGFEIFSSLNSKASAIARFVRKSVERKSMVLLQNFDDRYLSYIAYTYLQAFAEDGQYVSPSLMPCDEYFDRFYEDCGIYIHSNKSYYLVSNLKKGGAFKAVFRKNGRNVTDSGIMGIDVNGKPFSSGVLNKSYSVNCESQSAQSEGICRLLKNNVMDPGKNILLRLFQLTAGKSEKTGLFMKEKLRDILITSFKESEIGFRRKITARDDSLLIDDEISNPGKIEYLLFEEKSSDIYVPSSRYFIEGDLMVKPFKIDKSQLLAKLPSSGKAMIKRKYGNGGNLIELSVNGEKISP